MEDKTQEQAAAAADMSVRSARKWAQGPMPSAMKKARHWRTRKDPLDGIWAEEIVPLLEADTKGVLQATSIVAELEHRHPEMSLQGQLRTLQRRMRDWKAIQGPPREVFFPQDHQPGVEGAFDFTHGNDLGVTIAGEEFPHLIFEFVLSSSKHTRTSIAHGETFEALSSGLQSAFWEIGGVPEQVRSDNLSAATHELKKAKGRSLTRRYRGLLEHYRASSTLIRPGKANENGVVEQRHRWTKKYVAEALVFRGNKDFSCVEEYAAFVQDVIDRRHNAKHRDAFEAEKERLTPLPVSRLPDCTEYTIKVTRWSTLRVLGRIYSVPYAWIVGLGNASELLFMGELVEAEQALRIGLVNRVGPSADECVLLAAEWAKKLARGPAFAHSMTKQMLESEAQMPLADAIEAEAQVQAICMQHSDFRTAHDAFKNKQEPVFLGAAPVPNGKDS